MVRCENCETNHEGTFGSGRFCSLKCSRAFSTKAKRKEINEKVAYTRRINAKYQIVEKKCKLCEKSFSTKKALFCSRSCQAKFSMNTPEMKEKSSIFGRKSAALQKHLRRSKNEISFATLCNENFKNVLCNEPIFNGWDADVILPDLKIAILWNGKWHYEHVMGSLTQIQNRDRIKLEEIAKAGFVSYVIKDMGREDEEFVKTEFEKFAMWCNGSTKVS